MRAALSKARGNVSEAARLLGVTRRQIAYRLKDLELE
jgi:transcriptional regulator with GAF, ATPase, and Fis domain